MFSSISKQNSLNFGRKYRATNNFLLIHFVTLSDYANEVRANKHSKTRYFSVTLWPDIYLQKTLYFSVSQRNIELKTSKHEFTDTSDQNKQGFDSSAGWNSLRLKRICARHCWLGELKAKILPVFLPQFLCFFLLVILQNPSKQFAWLAFGWNLSI